MVEGLPPDRQDFVEAQVAAGNYACEAEVVVRAVKAFREREENYQRFRADIRRRVQSIEERNFIDLNGDDELDRFFDELLSAVERDLPSQKSSSNEPISP
jgi:Arc/MetJ-type ribon-helix-helix transcriptional regulator